VEPEVARNKSKKLFDLKTPWPAENSLFQGDFNSKYHMEKNRYRVITSAVSLRSDTGEAALFLRQSSVSQSIDIPPQTLEETSID